MNRGKRMSRHARFSPRWALERLEDRTLLSGNVVAVVNHGNLVVTGQATGNEVLIQSAPSGLQVSSLDGTTTINGGPGPFTATGFTADVNVFMKHGSDVVDVGGTGMLTSLPHNLLVVTGAGGDTVSVENASITGNVTLVGGAGSDTLTVGSSSTEALVTVGGSVFIVGATGNNNTIAVFNADITGSLTILSFGADDQVQVGFDAGLGIIDETAPAHVTIGGSVDIATQGGDPFASFGQCDSFHFDDWSMGDSWGSSDRGGDWDGGFGDFGLGRFLSNDSAFFGGWHSWGDDGDSWGGGDWCGGHQSTSGGQDVSLADVTVTGNVDVHSGDGNNQILLGAAPLPQGGSSPLNLVFGPVTVGGKLQVSSGNGNNTVMLDGISVTGKSNVTTGSGKDDIAVLGNSGQFTGDFSINSGAGADNIAIINGATFLGNVTIKAGAGTDFLWVAQSLFQGSAKFDGGPGTNTFLQSQTVFPNNFTAGNPVVTSFQVNMPDVSPTDTIVTTNFGWLNTLLGV
jgi:large repetitive protein